MTETEVIDHWRNGARSELQSAKLLADGGQYSGALFHCHLAVEKGLKAQYMEELREEPPPTHNLVFVAEKLKREWSDDEKRQLDSLTQYAVAARYDDPAWAEHEATAENAARWIEYTDHFLTTLLP